MARLNWKQLLIAVALGAVFAALQGDPGAHVLGKLSKLSSTSCTLKSSC
jgi:hypothetical protein